MNNYKRNFDEFGNLRPGYSPWTTTDLIIAGALVGLIVALVRGWV